MGCCFRSTRCLKRCFTLAIVHFACLTTLAGEIEPLSNEIERFPVKLGRAIYVPVELLGEKHQFVLDTGCSINLLDVTFVDRLPPSRKTIGASGPGGSSSIRLLQAPEMKIGKKNPRTLLAEQDKFVGIIDFAEVRLATESNCSGIIGMEFLKSQVVRLNLAESFVAFRSEPTSQPAHVEKIRINDLKCPRISLQVSGSHLCPMTIDTGRQDGLVIETKLYDRLLQEQRILARGTTEYVTFDRTITSRVGVLDRVSLGPHQVRNVHVAEGKIPVMGLQFLRRFEVDLDFPNGQAYFRPSQQFTSPDHWNLAGFVVDRVEHQIVVYSTEAGGVAERNGIAKGDVILQMNGIPTSEMPLEKIGQLKEEPDTQLRLLIQRDGVTREVTLPLKAQPDPVLADDESPDFKRIPD
jgi:hypothetical protein